MPIRRLCSRGVQILERARHAPANTLHYTNHGGVHAVVAATSVRVAKLQPRFDPQTFELLCARITSCGSTSVTLVCLTIDSFTGCLTCSCRRSRSTRRQRRVSGDSLISATSGQRYHHHHSATQASTLLSLTLTLSRGRTTPQSHACWIYTLRRRLSDAAYVADLTRGMTTTVAPPNVVHVSSSDATGAAARTKLDLSD